MYVGVGSFTWWRKNPQQHERAGPNVHLLFKLLLKSHCQYPISQSKLHGQTQSQYERELCKATGSGRCESLGVISGATYHTVLYRICYVVFHALCMSAFLFWNHGFLVYLDDGGSSLENGLQ